MPRRLRVVGAGLLLLLCAAAEPGTIALPDTIILPDTIPLDTIPGDTIPEPVEVRNLPPVPRPVPVGWETGVWEWDREGLQATRAISLVELLEQVPGVIAIRGGDYGSPTTIMAAGLGPGRIRVFLDGAEMAPLDGGVVDLSRVGLVGLDRVRLERRPGELRVELIGLQVADPRPYTLLEVGTGDLQTNLFRGTFVHPTALGGNLVLALDRIDTDGPRREEAGAAFGVHFRHTLVRSDRGGLAWEVRRMTSRRPEEFYQPGDVSRTDWSVRGRRELQAGVILDAFFHRASLGIDETVPADTLVDTDARSQLGIRAALDRGSWWSEAEARGQWGDGWPGTVQALRAGGLLAGLGGASGSVERQGWEGSSGIALHGRVWSAPVGGISLYGEAETGRRAMPRFVPPSREEEPPAQDPPPDPPVDPPDPPEPAPDPRFSEVLGFRAGAEYRRGDAHFGAALLWMDPDSLHPVDLPFDRGGPSVAVGSRSGVEVGGIIPLTPILSGLSFEADARLWDAAEAWRYTPDRSWNARLRFHDVFLETRNLEVWGDVGVRTRGAMTVPITDGVGVDAPLQSVPQYQSWFARVQVRVVTVRLFVHWENFTFREDNQDIPGRLLPATRAMYGIRWTLWN
jgi:hypothetical protein